MRPFGCTVGPVTGSISVTNKSPTIKASLPLGIGETYARI